MTERSSALSYYLLRNDKVKKTSLTLEYIYNPLDVSRVRGFSQTSQNCSFLLGFIMDRPDLFASIIPKVAKNAEFPYIVQCIIPAIYGFFTSDELLDFATCFYRKVIEVCKPAVSIKLLEPLFISSVTYRYRESVLTSFFKQFITMLHQTSKDSISSVYPIQAEILINILISNSQFLPHQIHEIWQYTTDVKWGYDNQFNLFFNCFFFPVANNFIQTKGLSDHFSKVQNAIIGQRSLIRKLFKTLSGKTTIRLPAFYSPFDEQYFRVAISVYDIKLLAKVISVNGIMPDMLTLSEFEEINPKVDYHVIYPSVFPRPRALAKMFLDADIFQDSNVDVPGMRNYITMKLCEGMCKNWKDIVEENSLMWGCQFFHSVITDQMVKEDNLNDLYTKMIDHITDDEFKQRIFLVCLEKHFLIRNLDLLNQLQDIDNKWSSLVVQGNLNSKEFMQALDQMSQSRKTLISDSIRHFTESRNLPLHMQFVEISKSISAILDINNASLDANKLITFLFSQRPKGFLKIVLILLHCAMKNNLFNKLCSKREKESWNMIEATVNEILLTDIELYTQYAMTLKNLYQRFPVQ
ncbi:hypothetical protein TVAG_324250 [Trichomonas vaginalis G3]|uniref:Uncharacterized protein n=1 Tax=Trichomonas vaginalis (strain ATCC PRA-98 / G3) TaxID=412133 RepID=A2FT93_TRIV3|nr:hypothetical protein TVAG_324250 [Trichomonas vaginalis G3]|eukprot:XP_001304807.1 hypothetical protein [Trichomonas vaginalis G3]